MTPQFHHDPNTVTGGAILAAGLGTRMHPLTEHTPKPMIPTLGRPLIEWGMIALARAGIKTLGINSFHLAKRLQTDLEYHRVYEEVCGTDHINTHSHALRTSLFFIAEEELLGTGGGIKGIWRKLAENRIVKELLCINGDALFDFPLQPLLDTHRQESGLTSPSKVAGTLALRPVEPGDPFGKVGVDAKGRVVRIAEVTGPLSHTEVQIGAFTGAQVVTESVIERIPDGFCDVFRTAHKSLLHSEYELRAHFVDPQALWVDVGNLDRYIDAHRQLLTRPQNRLWRYIPPHHRVQDAILFEGAKVSNSVQLGQNVWIGQASSLEGTGAISDSLIWPETKAQVEGSVQYQVFTDRQHCP